MLSVRTASVKTQIEFCTVDHALSQLPRDSILVTDSQVLAAWPTVSGLNPIVVPAGEESKSLSEYVRVMGLAIERRPARKTPVVAFGGGVVGDLAGFVAATLLRGVPLIQIPTSLLAMVDSSVGGKVGVDTEHGKNLVGAFKPANQVWICRETLETLPPRHVVNGMAEVWKYVFIGNQPSLAEADRYPIATGTDVEERLIAECLQHKIRVVEADEFETNGLRATLNFGHTVGHAIEKVLQYQHFLHGEAISIGMVKEAELGERIGVTSPGTAKEIASRLAAQGLPTSWDGLSNVHLLVEAMRADKKSQDGQLAFSLLTQLGECKLITGVDAAEVELALRA